MVRAGEEGGKGPWWGEDTPEREAGQNSYSNGRVHWEGMGRGGLGDLPFSGLLNLEGGRFVTGNRSGGGREQGNCFLFFLARIRGEKGVGEGTGVAACGGGGLREERARFWCGQFWK